MQLHACATRRSSPHLTVPLPPHHTTPPTHPHTHTLQRLALLDELFAHVVPHLGGKKAPRDFPASEDASLSVGMFSALLMQMVQARVGGGGAGGTGGGGAREGASRATMAAACARRCCITQLAPPPSCPPPQTPPGLCRPARHGLRPRAHGGQLPLGRRRVRRLLGALPGPLGRGGLWVGRGGWVGRFGGGVHRWWRRARGACCLPWCASAGGGQEAHTRRLHPPLSTASPAHPSARAQARAARGEAGGEGASDLRDLLSSIVSDLLSAAHQPAWPAACYLLVSGGRVCVFVCVRL